jgi:hypothetical protein
MLAANGMMLSFGQELSRDSISLKKINSHAKLSGEHKDSVIIRKEYFCTFAKSTPKIDGILDDPAWLDVPSISDFRQSYPFYDVPAGNRTEVKMMYDNTAIYIGAYLYDNQPDSISMQLGLRDDPVNSDQFRLVFDTYNKQQDAFEFVVTASGVQMDSRFSDGSYNAVWESKTKITLDGWVVELKIPYSALRFPAKAEQEWGFQITRSNIRTGEFIQWALTPRGASNFYKYWGLLRGIDNIKAPIRLSLLPFITTSTSHYPSKMEGESNWNKQVVGGMDLKYGLNESYTLDLSLLPDFTQVQSDNMVKNLGAFEQVYDEQRPFFQENTDLFNRGDLFYSRRIGRTPAGYGSVYSEIKQGETVVYNPTAAKLLNISKVSGRSKNGVGLGVLNAVLDNTYAVVRDSLGNERQVLTEPFSNYSIWTIDRQLKNSSNAYLINTNAARGQGYTITNVTGAGLTLFDKNNTYAAWTDLALTNLFSKDTITDPYQNTAGFSYGVGIGKNSGKFTFDLNSEGISPSFNNNDMGVTQQRNFISNELEIRFNQFEPFKNFLNANTGLNLSHRINYSTNELLQIKIGGFGEATSKSFRRISFRVNSSPTGEIDYYEPRTLGRYFRRTPNIFFHVRYGSDYRKKFIFSASSFGGTTALVSPSIGYNPFFGCDFGPSIRMSDKLTLSGNGSYFEDLRDRGFVANDTNGDIIFGVRHIKRITYDFTIRYLFKNDLSLSFIGRHYWVRGNYLSYHNLSEDGFLLDETSYHTNHDFNYNAVNINMLLEWRFALGSYASLSWKNNINYDHSEIINSYGANFLSTIQSDQLNVFSLRILYYFDYLSLRKKQVRQQA